MTVDKWSDQGGMADLFQDSAFPIHDRILGIQAAVLTMLMNPTVLERVYDNETRIAADQDMLTLPEVFNKIGESIWTELDGKSGRGYTNRQPMISSTRRNLQREHLDRLIDLTDPGVIDGAAGKAVSNLAVAKLREIDNKIRKIVPKDSTENKTGLDDYTYAHLSEAALRIDKALDAIYVYNTDKLGGGGGHGGIFFFKPVPETGTQPIPETGSEPTSIFNR
jgi:hypothetical protein